MDIYRTVGRLMAVLIIGALAAGCAGNTKGSPSASPEPSDAAAITLACNDFPSSGTVSPVATLAVGAVLTVTMCNFGSDGGYSWADPVYDKSALALVVTDSIAPSSAPGVVGASGTSAWRFGVLADRNSTITFIDRRIWDKDNPLVVVVITVNVPPSTGSSAPSS